MGRKARATRRVMLQTSRGNRTGGEELHAARLLPADAVAGHIDPVIHKFADLIECLRCENLAFCRKLTDPCRSRTFTSMNNAKEMNPLTQTEGGIPGIVTPFDTVATGGSDLKRCTKPLYTIDANGTITYVGKHTQDLTIHSRLEITSPGPGAGVALTQKLHSTNGIGYLEASTSPLITVINQRVSFVLQIDVYRVIPGTQFQIRVFRHGTGTGPVRMVAGASTLSIRPF